MPAIDRERVAAALPRYILGDQLGSGSFGLVLAGRHVDLDRPVAVKVLPIEDPGPAGTGSGAGSGPGSGSGGRGGGSGSGDGSAAAAGFRAEARMLSRLDHPHIVRVYDYIGQDDLCLIVMELLDGGPLTRYRLRQDAACAVGLAMADALAHAHAHGVLHRDIKPDNILFTAAGQPKLTDFGIGKMFEGVPGTASRIVGTPRYMAPEQITGDSVGPAADLYALGVVLYELLAGRPPFDPRLPVPELLRYQCEVPPPYLDAVPAPIARVVMQALAKRPAERHPSGRDFAQALDEAATEVYGQDWTARTGLVLRLEGLTTAAEASSSQDLTPGIVTPASFSQDPVPQGPAVQPPSACSSPPPAPLTQSPPTEAPSIQAPPPQASSSQASSSQASSPQASLPHESLPQAPLAPPAEGAGAAPGPSPYGWPAPAPGRADTASPQNHAHGGGTFEGHPFAGHPFEEIRRRRRRRIITAVATVLAVALAVTGVLLVADGGREPKEDTAAVTPGGPPASAAAPAGGTRNVTLKNFTTWEVGPDGRFYLVDEANNRVVGLSADKELFPVAGTGGSEGFSGDDGPATEALLRVPSDVGLDAAGNVYIVDSGNGRIRRIDRTGKITTVVGGGGRSLRSNGTLPVTEIDLSPGKPIAVDTNGDIYFIDGVVICRAAGGVVTPVARIGDPVAWRSLPRVANYAGDIAVRDGRLYVADFNSDQIHVLDPDGTVRLLAGTGSEGYSGDGGPAVQAALNLSSSPSTLAVDGAGNLYVAEPTNYRVRRIDSQGIITTVAGTGSYGEPNEGAPAAATPLPGPDRVAVDQAGALYIGGGFGRTIWRVDSQGLITTILR